MAKAKKKGSRFLKVLTLIIIIAVIWGGYMVFGPATNFTNTNRYLYIRTGSNYEQLKAAVKEQLPEVDMFTFAMVGNMANLAGHVHPGKYRVHSMMSIYRLVRALHSGRQEQVNLVINRLRTKDDLVRLLATNLEADSAALRQMLSDPAYLSQFGLDTNTAMAAVMPNTYFFKWNTSADKAFRKIEDTYARFWNDSRKKKAADQGITPLKAIIVASIVDEETNMPDDKPRIASVYLNRLKKGMRLQADPTVKFAIGDFAIRRVTGPMLQTNSPYNTYMYEGLPPGPICTPSEASIEAVLNAPRTTYLYFCAKEDFSGYSNFASTYEEQIKNARAYQKALDARGIH